MRRPHHTPSWRPATVLPHALTRGYSDSAAKPPAPPPDGQDADGTPQPEDPKASEGDHAPSAEPWYLRVQPPTHLFAAEPPPLPDVPSDAPPVVTSVLNYASDEMGLEELALLDLRDLDPPPALGPNLFMLFGTARSERHLHVSAGRLVRWLRAKHRIHADADGLLGPNERKTKLRRKARRAKLMGTTGADDPNADDGITTGWICVNLGTINRSFDESAVVADDGRVAGFGVAHTGTTIVVQVMTDSRRAELGLEPLWLGSLARQKSNRQPQKHAEDEEGAESHPPGKPVLSNSPSRPALQKQSPDHSPFSGQSRSFSTTIQAAQMKKAAKKPKKDVEPVGGDPLLGDLDRLPELLHEGPTKMRLLDLLRIRLQNLTPVDAFNTMESASFRKLAMLAMQDLSAAQTWDLRLVMESKARLSGLREDQSLGNIGRLIRDLRVHAVPITREQALQLLGSLHIAQAPWGRGVRELVEELLECLQLRGEAVLASDVIVSMIEGMSWAGKPRVESLRLQRRLEELLVQANLPYMGDALLMRLMDSYIRMERYDMFWKAWRMPPQFARPRSEDMYFHVYETAAATSSPQFCAETIRLCFHEMLIEDPPIAPVGKIRNALLKCIQVVDSQATNDAVVFDGTEIGFRKMMGNREFVRVARAIGVTGTTPPALQEGVQSLP